MDNRELGNSTDGKIERAKDAALGPHDSHPSHVDEAGEAAGGISGVLAGAAIGSIAGPVGTLIGGIAGAVGGWWSGRAVTEAASKLTKTDDDYYREHYEHSSAKLADRSYDEVRPAYHLGQVASQNPDYANRSWNDVQSELQRGWSAEQTKKYGEFAALSGYASEGFSRGKASYNSSASGSSHAAERTFDRAEMGAEKVGHSVADKLDKMADRIEGKPVSKPGTDATDAPHRMDSR